MNNSKSNKPVSDGENAILPARRLGQIGSVFIMLASLGAQAQQPGYNATSAELHITNAGLTQSVTDAAYAQYNYPLISGQNSGFVGLSGPGGAGVPAITAGAYASSSDGGWVSTSASYTTAMLVGSGTSGLVNGTPVTLQMSLQLDGMTSATSGDDAGYAYMSFDLSISAPDQAIFNPGDGWYEPRILDFSTYADNNVDNFFTTFYGDPNGAWYHSTEYRSGWNWNSNLGSGEGGLVDEYLVEAGRFSSTATRDFDTGVLLLNFETFVGDTLNIASFLNVYGDTYGDGSAASVDFLNTLRASITSPFVGGLSLEYGATGSPVPVPPAIWLFATALLGFVGFGRRNNG